MRSHEQAHRQTGRAGFLLGTALCLGVAGMALAATPAAAVPVGSLTQVDFTGTSTDITYGGGTFTLSDNGSPPASGSPVSVSTTSTAAVMVVLGAPTTFFDPLTGPAVVDATAMYAGFATPEVIPYSASPSFLGLSVSAMDGTHYGYAEFAGTDLLSYAFESTPDLGIVPGILRVVPEPISLTLLASGLVGLGVARQRRRR